MLATTFYMTFPGGTAVLSVVCGEESAFRPSDSPSMGYDL